MRGISTALLAAATAFLPLLPLVGHADLDLGPSSRGQQVLVTGHDAPDPALHVEPLSGTLELDCLGCLLDQRQQAWASSPRPIAKPATERPTGPIEMVARRLLEPPAYRSPRAPPIA